MQLIVAEMLWATSTGFQFNGMLLPQSACTCKLQGLLQDVCLLL